MYMKSKKNLLDFDVLAGKHFTLYMLIDIQYIFHYVSVTCCLCSALRQIKNI